MVISSIMESTPLSTNPNRFGEVDAQSITHEIGHQSPRTYICQWGDDVPIIWRRDRTAYALSRRSSRVCSLYPGDGGDVLEPQIAQGDLNAWAASVFKWAGAMVRSVMTVR